MRRKSIFTLIALFLVVSFVMISGQAMAAEEKKEPPKQYLPILTYRTGPFQAGGSGTSGGWEDYYNLVNIKGGLNGIMIDWEECEFGYNTARGVECYERVKPKNPVVIHPFSTGVTYALIERATRDHIPLISLGYGRADASDGRVFPYVFPLMTNYWSQNSAKIRYIAQKEGGLDKLKGLKIANLHLDVPYGQETKFILEILSKKFGFEVQHFPVPWPGIDQKSLWLKIRRFKPDWVINRNWGVSCTVPLREAARMGFPRDKIIGVWWCGSEEDAMPAGEAGKGYLSTNFHGVGKDFPVIQEIIEKVHGTLQGNISFTRVGMVYYNRGIITGIITTEAILTAHKKFGVKVITGEEMQWALENLNITEERIKELGAEGLMMPVKTSWKDHEGGGYVRFQQWDGTKWVSVSDWVAPFKDLVRAEIEKSAAKYAEEKKITIRTSEEMK
ncbi:MAG: ABC transporter substrate-binding protein [Pseudomonadota bacterium]